MSRSEMSREVHTRGLRWLSETADMDVHATERSEDVTKLSHKLNENERRPWNLSVLRSPVWIMDCVACNLVFLWTSEGEKKTMLVTPLDLHPTLSASLGALKSNCPIWGGFLPCFWCRVSATGLDSLQVCFAPRPNCRVYFSIRLLK